MFPLEFVRVCNRFEGKEDEDEDEEEEEDDDGEEMKRG